MERAAGAAGFPAGLFGDGAAAVLVAGSEVDLPGPEIVGARSVFYPNSERVMGWDISEKGFRILLSPEFPIVVREHLREDADAFLEEFGLTRADIGLWILHAGGTKALEATQEAWGVDAAAVAASWDCLRRAVAASEGRISRPSPRSLCRRKAGVHR